MLGRVNPRSLGKGRLTQRGPERTVCQSQGCDESMHGSTVGVTEDPQASVVAVSEPKDADVFPGIFIAGQLIGKPNLVQDVRNKPRKAFPSPHCEFPSAFSGHFRPNEGFRRAMPNPKKSRSSAAWGAAEPFSSCPNRQSFAIPHIPKDPAVGSRYQNCGQSIF